MSEHDDAGNAETLPPLPPPPPPQPAASRASPAAKPNSAASEILLLTRPPQSPTGPMQRGPAPAAGASIGPWRRHFNRQAPLQWPERAEVAELADAPDSKSGSLRGVWVRFPPSALANVRSPA